MDIVPADAAAGAGSGLSSLVGMGTATVSLCRAPSSRGDALIPNLSLALKPANLQEASKSTCSCFTLMLSSGLLQNNPLQASSCPHQGTFALQKELRTRSLCCRHSRCLLLQRKRQEVRQEENMLLPARPPPFLLKSS